MKNKTVIILISDNHDLESAVYDVPPHHPEAQYFFHCGDSELPYAMLSSYAAVKGNNDFDPGYPDFLTITIGCHRFLLTHGHRYYCGFGYDDMLRKAKEEKCDIVCYGHTHRYDDRMIDGVRFLNPGSIWHNRDGSPSSYMRITLEGKNVKVERLYYPFSLQ